MAGLIEVPLDDGGVIVVEVDDAVGDGVVRAARPGQIAGRATQTLGAALETLKPTVQTVLAKLRDLEHRPREISVEFGLKLSLEAGVIISKTSGEANFTVTLRWQRDDA